MQTTILHENDQLITNFLNNFNQIIKICLHFYSWTLQACLKKKDIQKTHKKPSVRKFNLCSSYFRTTEPCTTSATHQKIVYEWQQLETSNCLKFPEDISSMLSSVFIWMVKIPSVIHSTKRQVCPKKSLSSSKSKKNGLLIGCMFIL